MLRCFVAAALLSAFPAWSAPPRLSFTSYGPVRIGMSRAALEGALGSKLDDGDVVLEPRKCEYANAGKDHENIDFMLVDDRLVRIDVHGPGIATRSGAHVGSTEAEIMALYPGRIIVSPHAYATPEGMYLTLHSADGRHGLRFETYAGVVTSFYAGTAEALEDTEGCQ